MANITSAPTTLSNVEILKHFRDNVVTCLNGLIDLFPYDKNLIAFRVVFETGVSLEDVMRIFSHKIIPLGKMVRAKANAFFLDDTKSFRLKLGSIELNWKALWQSNSLDAEDRQSIWSYMNLFLGLSQMYAKNQGWDIKEEEFSESK